jgi:hypothetical protein
VYPRAYCAPENYVGNRYDYETQVNDIAWRLTWLNREILAGKRGLIQRAVDNYRNLFKESRSRRVIRQDKISTGTLRRRSTDSFPPAEQPPFHASMAAATSGAPSPTALSSASLSSLANRHHVKQDVLDMMTAVISYEDRRGKIVQTKIKLNVDLVETSMITDEKFKLNNCLFPRAYARSLQYYNNPIRSSDGNPSTYSFICCKFVRAA